MRVLIVEPDLTGHHLPYLRHLISAVAELNQEAVVLTCAGASQTPQFLIHLADVAAQATWDESLPADSRAQRQTGMLVAEILKATRRHGIDQVWEPYADFITAYLGARRLTGRKIQWPAGVEAEGLFFRGIFAYPAASWKKRLRRFISRILLPHANWEVLHFLDPLPYELMREQHPKHAHRFRLMPDPIEGVPQVAHDMARARLGIPTGGRFAGCMGVLYDKVGIDLLLRAFRRADLKPDDRLLLAGPMNDAVRNHVNSAYGDLLRAGHIVTIDRHLNLDEVMLAVMASDVVCIPNPFRMGSSSFVIRAAAARRPVLADDFGWTGATVQRFGLGWCVDIWNEPAYAAALQTAIEQAATKTFSPAADRFARFHLADNFKAHWTSRLRERMELPQDPRLLTWEWVLQEPMAAPAG